MKKYPTQNAQIISKKDTKYCEKNLGAKIPPQNAQKTQKGILKTNLNATRNTRCVPELVPEPAQFLPVNARARSYPTFQYPSPLDTRLFATRCIPMNMLKYVAMLY